MVHGLYGVNNMDRIATIAESMLENYPDEVQSYDWDCGASAVQSVMAYYGNNITEEALIKSLGTNPDEGTSPAHIIDFFKKEGFDVKYGRMTIGILERFVDQKFPVIIVLQAYREDEHSIYKDDWEDGHYVVVIGYDDDKIFFEDPSSMNKTYLTYDELEERWHDTANGIVYDHFGIVIIGERDEMLAREYTHLD